MGMRNFFSLTAFFFLLTLVSGRALSAEGEGAANFRMSFLKDDVLIVRKEQEILAGAGRSREEKNRIVLKALESGDEGTTLEGSFLTYSRSPAGKGPFQRDRDYNSRFRILKTGAYEVPDQHVMPNVRSLPTFPERSLSPGDMWEAPALETIDIGTLKIKIPFNVRYKYIGPEKTKDYYGTEKAAHKILFAYELNHRVVPGNGPIAIIQGRSTDEMWFSTDEAIPIYDVQTIMYRFHMKDGTTRESAYRVRSWYEKVRRTTPETRQTMKDEIKKGLEDRATKNVEVRETDQGISLDLNNILFAIDSDELSDEARKSLDHVAEILAKYPDREIRIQGHTDNTGGTRHNLDLSTRRARSVHEYLEGRGVKPDRLSYRGFGESRPVESNATEEGRARNRRVEILIVTE